MMLLRLLCCCTVLLLSSLPVQAEEGARVVVIGAGRVTGQHYPVAGAVCRTVNVARASLGLRCLVESSEGPASHLAALRAGTLDAAIVPSDWLQHAVQGSARFRTAGADTGLRVLFALHSEALTVVARADSGIRNFADVRGRRLNLGPPGSASRALLDLLLETAGWSLRDRTATSEWPIARQMDALCENRADAVAFVVGHPHGAVHEITAACDAVPVSLAGDALERLLAAHPHLVRTHIPAGMYPDPERDDALPAAPVLPAPATAVPAAQHGGTPTLGLRALLVTSTRLDNETAYQLVKGVFTAQAVLREQYPVLEHLEPSAMIQGGITAPLHEGALRYYREAGLIPAGGPAGAVTTP